MQTWDVQDVLKLNDGTHNIVLQSAEKLKTEHSKTLTLNMQWLGRGMVKF